MDIHFLASKYYFTVWHVARPTFSGPEPCVNPRKRARLAAAGRQVQFNSLRMNICASHDQLSIPDAICARRLRMHRVRGRRELSNQGGAPILSNERFYRGGGIKASLRCAAPYIDWRVEHVARQILSMLSRVQATCVSTSPHVAWIINSSVLERE